MEVAPIWVYWCMGRLSRTPAWPGCLVLLGHGTAGACGAVSCQGLPAGQGLLAVWWPLGGSSKCSARAPCWIKRKMCKGGFARWCREPGAVGSSDQKVCPTGGSMWKTARVHVESHVWKTSRPGGCPPPPWFCSHRAGGGAAASCAGAAAGAGAAAVLPEAHAERGFLP